MNTRSVRSGLLAIALAAGLSPHGHAQGLDETLLNISLREDPVYPVPEIGQRRFYCRYQSESGWSDPRMILRFASQTSALENTFAGAPGVTEIPAASITQQELGGSVRQAEWIMPWRKRNPGAANLQGPPELFADGSSGFYQWVVEYVADGSTKRLFGDVHTFTQPRRLVFGVMGDSFGSGEGAPAVGSTPWINTAGHRSAVSGSEIALSLLRNNYPHLAFDYFNTTSSGAIAHDIWSETGQASRAGSDGQGIGTPQAKLLEAFLAKPEKDHHYNSYTHVDAIILSCGGNDFGFSTIVEHYFGVPALGMETTAALCIPALVIGGIPGFVGCMGLSILADYSFEQGNEAPFVSEGKWRHFPFYRDRLKGQYEKLEKRLVRDLRPGTDPERQTTAKVHQFLVTEYPNPLKPCKNHWNTKSYSTFRTLSGPFSA